MVLQELGPRGSLISSQGQVQTAFLLLPALVPSSFFFSLSSSFRASRSHPFFLLNTPTSPLLSLSPVFLSTSPSLLLFALLSLPLPPLQSCSSLLLPSPSALRAILTPGGLSGKEVGSCLPAHRMSPSAHLGPGRSPQSKWGVGKPLPHLYYNISSQERRPTSICSAQAWWHTARDQQSQSWSSLSLGIKGQGLDRHESPGAITVANWPWWWSEGGRGEAHSSMPQSSPGHSSCARPCSDFPGEPY